MTASEALAAAAALYCLPPALLLSRSRREDVCEARWLAMAWLWRDGWSMPRIAAALGRNHSTVAHGLARAGMMPFGRKMHTRASAPVPYLVEVLGAPFGARRAS
jgi:hypothetical protein